METLDHRTFLTAGKLHQPTGIGAGDSQRMNHLIFVETQESSGRHGSTKGSSQSGGMETALLQGIAGSDADATHNFTGRHEGGQESFPVRLLHLARSEGREKSVAPG